MERLGIFGGTFDPPHFGHLILASEAAYQLHLDRVLWVLTPDPPHKNGQIISPIQDRIDLVCAAITRDPCFELSLVDVNRQPPHYSVDTLRILLDQYPSSKYELVFLIGGDSLANILSWHKPRELVSLIRELGVFPRADADIDLPHLEESIPGVTQKIHWIGAPMIDISASYIRNLVKQSGPYRYYLSSEVASIIQSKKLYQSKVD